MDQALRYAIAVTSIMACLLVGEARADFTSGNRLWDACQANDKANVNDAVKAIFCTSYILGAAETFQALHEANQVTYYCVPSGVENGQVEDVVKLYLRDHPETRQKSAPTLVMLALKEKFPCQEGGPDGEKATPRPGLPPGFGISPSRPQ